MSNSEMAGNRLVTEQDVTRMTLKEMYEKDDRAVYLYVALLWIIALIFLGVVYGKRFLWA
jgi:hypothetical protein